MSSKRDVAIYGLYMWVVANEMRHYWISKALEAGVTKTEIAEITGLARTTIDRIIKLGK